LSLLYPLLYLSHPKLLNSSSSGNKLSPDQQEDNFFLFCIVTSPDGEGTCLRLQPGQGISAFKIELSNIVDLPVQQLNLTYKLEQQPNMAFVLNTNQDVQYLLEVFRAYSCRVVNVMARAAAHDASSSRIYTQVDQR